MDPEKLLYLLDYESGHSDPAKLRETAKHVHSSPDELKKRQLELKVGSGVYVFKYLLLFLRIEFIEIIISVKKIIKENRANS